MRTNRLHLCAALFLVACGGSSSSSSSSTSPSGTSGSSSSGDTENTSSTEEASPDGSSNEFQIKDSTTAGSAHGATASKIKGTKTKAAMKFFVVDKAENEPIPGIVISLQSKDGSKYYTDETDSMGYGEVLVPIGQSYELIYLTLGQKDINAKVTVKDLPNQNIKLTLRYKRWVPRKVAVALPPDAPETPELGTATPAEPPQPVFRLDGVTFGTNSATLSPESFERLDRVVEYLTHKKSARIEVSGHTDNVGKPAKNKKLSQKRADACKAYLVDNGVAAERIEAIGYGDAIPVASNKDDAGREQNRRIEAKEL